MYKIMTKYDLLLIVLMVISYIWGVVSYQNYLPATTSFLSSLSSATILSGGLFLYFIKQNNQSIAINTILWFSYFVLLLVQPLFHYTPYFDDTLLSALTVLLCVLLSSVMTNLSKEIKHKAVIMMAWGILFSGLFTIIAQFYQLMHWHFLDQILFMKATSGRLAGNLAQPNQAAFVLTMALSAFIYLCIEYKEKVLQYKLWVVILANIMTALMLFGIALTSSRGGILLLLCAILGGAVLYYHPLKTRCLILFGLIPACILGYIVGTDAIQSYNNDTISAVGRLVGESETLSLRTSLLQQAWLAFESSPIVGVGWNDLSYFGLQHAELLNWFTVANHSHNLPAQIAAEFGILGLIPFVAFLWIGLKNFSFKLEAYKAFSYIILGLTFAYSLSEYPLWYFRFLLLAVFFVAIIDNSKISFKFDFSKVAMIVSLLFVLGGGYYIKQYYRYVDVAYALQSGTMDYQQERLIFQGLPNVFGYTKYKELMFYMTNPISDHHVEQQIVLGERVLSSYLTGYLMIKQANLQMIAGNQEEADRLFRASCLFTIDKYADDYCVDVVTNLRANIQKHPEYQAYLDRLEAWYQARFGKPLPEPKQE